MMTDMTPEELIKQVPFRLTDDEICELQAHGLLKDNIFVYKCDTMMRGVRVHCSECGEDVFYDKVVRDCYPRGSSEIGFMDDYGLQYFTGDKYNCPYCDAIGIVRHSSRISVCGHSFSSGNVAKIYRIGESPVVAFYLVGKEIDRDGDVRYFTRGIFLYAILDNKMVFARGFGRYFSSICSYSNWDRVLRMKYYEVISHYTFPFEKTLFDGTFYENLHLYEYIKYSQKDQCCAPHVYLSLWRSHKHVENIVTARQTKLLNRLIFENVSRSYYCDNCYSAILPEMVWKKKRPCDMFGLTKKQLERFRSRDFDISEYRVLSVFMRFGIELTDEQTLQCLRSNWEYDSYKDVLTYGKDVFGAMSYLEKQPKGKYEHRPSVITLVDYWRLVEKCGEALTADKFFPKDLCKEHDRYTERYKAVKDVVLEQKIEARGKRFEKYAFADEKLGLMIKPCMHHQELVDEGAALKHCVGSYGEKVASGKSHIFFVRRITEPEKAYYTLELNPKTFRIVQDHGFRNKLQTDEIYSFEERWLNYLKGGKSNERTGRDRAGCAAAGGANG